MREGFDFVDCDLSLQFVVGTRIDIVEHHLDGIASPVAAQHFHDRIVAVLQRLLLQSERALRELDPVALGAGQLDGNGVQKQAQDLIAVGTLRARIRDEAAHDSFLAGEDSQGLKMGREIHTLRRHAGTLGESGHGIAQIRGERPANAFRHVAPTA